MKKFTTLLTMAFIALMSISFTSCDDDSDIAYTLDGTWKGNMLVEYGNHNALYSVIRFDQNDGLLIGGIKIRLKISIFYGEKVVHLADF